MVTHRLRRFQEASESVVGSASQELPRAASSLSPNAVSGARLWTAKPLSVAALALSLVLGSIVVPPAVGAQDAETEAPALEVPAEADGSEEVEVPEEAEPATAETEVDSGGVLVPGSPTTEADPEAEAEGTGDGISVDREQSRNGIRPSSVVTLIIVALLVVGLALALLTLAYWFRTRPSRNQPSKNGSASKKRGAKKGKTGKRGAKASKAELPPSENPRRREAGETNGVAEGTGAHAVSPSPSPTPSASAPPRPAAADPTISVPAVDVDSGAPSESAQIPIARSRPKRSEKADRAALVQRVREDSPGSRTGAATTGSNGAPVNQTTSTTESKGAPATGKVSAAQATTGAAGGNGAKPKSDSFAAGPEDPLVELSLED